MPPTKRRERYKPPSGVPVLVASKAWGVEFDFFTPEAEPEFERTGDRAVVTICGPMTKGPGWWGDSYQEIGKRCRAAFDSDAARICLRVDSPGGDLAGCFELAHDLRAMADGTGKLLDVFTDGECCSGAMALASAATGEIVATPQAFLGSIGVWSALVDTTASDAMWGVKVIIAASGEHKADWNPHVPITEDAFKRLQAQVMAQAELFYALVSNHRGLSVDALRELKGAAPFGQAALLAGLCDRLVPSWSAFLSGETDMPPNRSKTSKYDEALGALKAAEEEGTDEEKKKVKRMLKAAEEPEESEDDKKKKQDKEAEEARAAEEAKATKVQNVELARRVQTLEAEAAERGRREKAEAEGARRGLLFAKRPDFGPEVRAALEKLPLEELEKAVQTFPRVIATPEAAANAQVPVVSGGERRPSSAAGGYQPTLSADEQRMLERSEPGRRDQVPARAVSRGPLLQMPKKIVTEDEARARLAELDKETV